MIRKILVVDDSESIREVISIGLSKYNFEIIKGINGENGLNKLIENKNIELVITDLNMPVMDGITLLKEIRKFPEFKFLPVIVLTTESQESKKQEARNEGATAWIVKPFTIDKLISVIKKIIN